MTVEQLKEKLARYLHTVERALADSDAEIACPWQELRGNYKQDYLKATAPLIETFIKFCEANNIYQVEQWMLWNELTKADMKPVSSLLGVKIKQVTK